LALPPLTAEAIVWCSLPPSAPKASPDASIIPAIRGIRGKAGAMCLNVAMIISFREKLINESKRLLSVYRQGQSKALSDDMA
jgi:hypothetical protein